MNLTIFNAENFPQKSRSNTTPTITIGKQGAISINPAAVNLMGLKAGDQISFAQDDDAPENWYIFKGKDGYKTRFHSDKKTLAFNQSSLAQSLRECFELDNEKSLRFLVGGVPTVIDKVKYYGLILNPRV